MIVVTADQIEGKKVVKTLGLVKGNSIRAGIWEETLWPACGTSLAVRSLITLG